MVDVGPGLVGRDRERARLRTLADAARAGFGEVLVLRGDPGVGKTALLDDLGATATGVDVTTLSGIETESGLAFAGVHRLLLPFRDLAPRLPDTQRDALRVALGLDAGPPPDRYLVGLGALSLLTEAGADLPRLICVDDVQWLDQETLDALAFVARRLQADRISLVLAVRTGIAVTALAGLPEVEVTGLDSGSAHELLARVVPSATDPVVARRIVAATRGVPLAIVDLGRELSESQLAGEAVLPDPVPLGSHLEAHYVGKLDALPDGPRTWLLLAAAEPSGDLARVTRAAEALGVSTADARQAEATGLVSVRGRIDFRHPLVRSAIYGAAGGQLLREVHGALAETTTGAADLDRRAWHLAASRVEPDEQIAAVLEVAAERARDRGGYAARVAFLVRAVELTPPGPARVDRTLGAAEAATIAGAPVQAVSLLESLDAADLDPVSRGRLLSVRAAVHVFSGTPGAAADVPTMYLQAARAFEAPRPDLARLALARSFDQVGGAEWMLRGSTVAEIATLTRRLVGEEPEGDLADVVLAGLAALALDPYEVAVPRMRRAVSALSADDVSDDELLAVGPLSVVVTTALFDDGARTELLVRTAAAGRRAGALGRLDPVLWVLALTEADIGQLAVAERLLAEVRQLREAVGMTPDQIEMFKNVEYLALRGSDPDLEDQVERSAQASIALGYGGAETMSRAARSLLATCAGDYETAYALSSQIWESGFLQVALRELPDVVEAAVFTGRREQAEAAAVMLGRIAAASGSRWARGLDATARALLAEGPHVDECFREAVHELDGSRNVSARARTHLLYGEWLLRSRRRTDARYQLRTALELFEGMGAARYAARARRELLASGGKMPEPEAAAPTALTPRETSVAAMAADGATNAEIAATLLLSPHTVDFHLRKVFRKLQVNSRRELARALRRVQEP